MAKCRYAAQEALYRLFHQVPTDTKLVDAEVEDGKLVLVLSGPNVPNVAEVRAADMRSEETMTMLTTRTVFVPIDSEC